MIQKTALTLGVLSALMVTSSTLADDTLSLQEAIEIARNAHDPSVEAIRERALSEEDDSVAARALPDPRIGLGFANIPVDDFSLTREPFTQLQVSARQAFPRGNTRALNAQSRTIRSEDYRAQAQAQSDTLIRDVSIAWFNVHYSRTAEEELQALNTLLSDLNAQQESDFAASGSAALQRLYRTELEQALVEDRLDAIIQERDSAVEILARYIGRSAATLNLTDYAYSSRPLPSQPQIEQALENNPVLISMERQIDLARNGADLAKQAYKPEFGVEARYGRRGDDRSDFGSLMVTFDLPIFTSKRQDPALRAARRREQAARLERDSVIRDLTQQALSYVATVTRLRNRIERFEGVTLERANDAVTASRNAYGAGNIDFAELVRAEIALRDLRLRRAMLYRDLYIAEAQLKFIVGEAA
jgi:outer membrane protein TolC